MDTIKKHYKRLQHAGGSHNFDSFGNQTKEKITVTYMYNNVNTF